MIKRICIVLLLLSTCLTLSSFKHPIKLTSSQIRYNPKTDSIGIETKVFIDDFAPAVSNDLLTRMDKPLTEVDKILIESYFALKFEITIKGKKLPLKIANYTVKGNVMTLSFAKSHVSIEKGDKIYIENELLFEEFEELQSNWISLLVPPFLPNHNFACDYENYSYAHTF